MSRLISTSNAKIFAACLVAMVLLMVAAYRYWEPGWRYDVQGVDVSHHQGPIDWDALAGGDAASFAYIKATEGGDWVDPRFDENWQAAGDAGVLRGAYHFFTLCSPAVDQAANMMSTVPVADPMLPPAVDLEFDGNCSQRPDRDAFNEELDTFLQRMEDHYGRKPVVYTTYDFYDTYLAGRQLDVSWWIRSIVSEPRTTPVWTFWQYFPGDRAGVDGPVDRNVYRGTEEDLRALTHCKLSE